MKNITIFTNWIQSWWPAKHSHNKNPCKSIKIKNDRYNSYSKDIQKGDTVSINGISGIYFCNPNLGIVAMRPVPSVKMSKDQAMHCDSRGLEFYALGKTDLYHIESFEQEELIPNKRVVLVEKTTWCLIRTDKKHMRITKE